MRITTKSTPDYLKMTQLFSELSTLELDVLRDNVRYRTIRKGDVVDYKRKEAKYVYLILSGVLKLGEINENGEEMIKEVVKEGDLFGELIQTSTDFHYEFAEAISSRVMLALIPSRILHDTMKNNSGFAMNYSKAIWLRYKKFEKRYRNLAFLKDTKSRLISFFKDLALSEGSRKGNNIVFRNYLTHQEIASMIGTTRVTVTNILNQLRDSGSINYCKRQVEIVDIDRFN